MAACWTHDPEGRPGMDSVTATLTDICDADGNADAMQAPLSPDDNDDFGQARGYIDSETLQQLNEQF